VSLKHLGGIIFISKTDSGTYESRDQGSTFDEKKPEAKNVMQMYL
jgi:hypothetical protein